MDLNKNIKIFFIDLDGTLLDIKKDHTHSISETNLNAIKEAQEKGIKIVISTGRQGVPAKKYLDMIDYEYAVTGNGSVILKDNKVIRDIKMSLRQSLLITDFAKKHSLVMKMDDSRIAYGCFKKTQAWLTSKWGFTPVKNFNFEMHKQCHKMVLWGKSRGKMKKLFNKLNDEIKGLSIVTSGNGFTIEISHESASKGSGNLFVAELMGITKKNQMAHIGDSMNDSTPKGHMKLIAMSNSDKNLKKIADYIGPSYKGAGVAKILRGKYKEVKK